MYRALANAEKVFTGWMLAGQAALTSPVLPVRLRELVVLRTAYLMDCPYELGQHRDVARTAGVGARRDQRPSSPNPIGKKPISARSNSRYCSLTTELLTTRNVSAELFDQVHTALGSEATVELLMVISRYAGLALMLNALQVDLDESARRPSRDGLRNDHRQSPFRVDLFGPVCVLDFRGND